MHYIILVVVQVDFYMLLIYSRSCWPIASISEPVSLLDFQLVVIQPANSWSWLVKSVVTIYYTLMKICHPTNNWLNGRTTQQVLFYGHHILRTSKQAKNSLTSMDPLFFFHWLRIVTSEAVASSTFDTGVLHAKDSPPGLAYLMPSVYICQVSASVSLKKVSASANE
jgi:hypothetical protein